MSTTIDLINTPDWDKQDPATAQDIQSLEAAFGPIPEDYKALLLFSNGSGRLQSIAVIFQRWQSVW
jgi:hypothetical protein